ncbi:MAG: glutathione S-transferase family protein [Gammaproteobacteria bacterium]|nr:glutathione S-transferase family protein [Gammaproteobacteria bacterium]
MKPKLISFTLCPFVQRAVIVLEHKKIDYDIVYIDLADPPAWFLDLSPLKQVPVLQVGEHVIFESAVINEYLDETYPPPLHPRESILRAKNRSWIEFGSACLGDAFQLSIKETEQEFIHFRDELQNKFDHLEKVVRATPFFNGTAFSLVDAGYAPLLQRLDYLAALVPDILNPARHPNINTWKNNLLKLEAVRKSCVPEIKTLYYEYLWKRQGYIVKFLDKSRYPQAVTKSIY